MKKSKKIILSVVCIISAIVISSVPAFANELVAISPETWSSYSGIPLASNYNSLKISLPDYSVNGTTFSPTWYSLSSSNRYKFNDLSFTYNSSRSPRITFTLRNSVDIPSIYQTNGIWPEPIPASYINSGTTYSKYSYGAFVFEFDIYIGVSGNRYDFLDLFTHPKLYGYKAVTSQPEGLEIQSSINSQLDTYEWSRPQDSRGPEFNYIYDFTCENLGYISGTERYQYHCRLITNVYSNLYETQITLTLPIFAEPTIVPTPVTENYNIEIRDFNSIYYSSPSDVPGFFYIPEFNSSFDDLEDIEDYFDDSLDDAIDEFKWFQKDVTNYLKKDLKNGFAVLGVFLDDIIEIKAIRILFVFSFILGIFAFVINGHVNPLGVKGSKVVKSISKNRKDE